MTLAEALELRKGRSLVFTNGVFDLLHVGHVRYLRQARALGDLLILGVNSDESVRRLNKGPERPLNPAEERIELLEALRWVDGAVEFGEDTPIELILQLRPEVHVKGGDYRIEDLPETPIVQEYGGRVEILPFVAGRSTTSLVNRMRDR